MSISSFDISILHRTIEGNIVYSSLPHVFKGSWTRLKRFVGKWKNHFRKFLQGNCFHALSHSLNGFFFVHTVSLVAWFLYHKLQSKNKSQPNNKIIKENFKNSKKSKANLCSKLVARDNFIGIVGTIPFSIYCNKFPKRLIDILPTNFKFI